MMGYVWQPVIKRDRWRTYEREYISNQDLNSGIVQLENESPTKIVFIVH
jgi:hypothetical protein